MLPECHKKYFSTTTVTFYITQKKKKKNYSNSNKFKSTNIALKTLSEISIKFTFEGRKNELAIGKRVSGTKNKDTPSQGSSRES